MIVSSLLRGMLEHSHPAWPVRLDSLDCPGVYSRTRQWFDAVFFAFVLPTLEYCSQVWGSAADTHLRLLDRHVRSVAGLCPTAQLPSLAHRRRVAGVCMLYKIFSNPSHLLGGELPEPQVARRLTRASISAHEFTLSEMRCRTSQFMRCFIPSCVRLWNGLPSEVFGPGTLDGFKRAVHLSLF